MEVILRYDGEELDLISEWIKDFFNIKNIQHQPCINFSRLHKIAYQNEKNPLKAVLIKVYFYLLFKQKVKSRNQLKLSVELLDPKEKLEPFHSFNIIKEKCPSSCMYVQHDTTFISTFEFREYGKYHYILTLIKLITNDYCNKLGIFDCEMKACICHKFDSLQELDKIELTACNFHTKKIGNLVGRTFGEQSKMIEKLALLLYDYFRCIL